MSRAVVLFDVEYFRIAFERWGVDGVPSSNSLIESLVVGARAAGFDVDAVDRWRCYAYDAEYRGDALGLTPSSEVDVRHLDIVTGKQIGRAHV